MRSVTKWFAKAQNPCHAAPQIRDLIDDLVIANHILFQQGVLDSFGHVSARHPTNSNHFLMSRAMAPGLVQPPDILAFDLDGVALKDINQSLYIERFIHSELYKARGD